MAEASITIVKVAKRKLYETRVRDRAKELPKLHYWLKKGTRYVCLVPSSRPRSPRHCDVSVEYAPSSPAYRPSHTRCVGTFCLILLRAPLVRVLLWHVCYAPVGGSV